MSRTRFPYLTRAIKAAPVVELPRVDGKGTYKFRAYPFGEMGGKISYQLIREISKGLAEYAAKYFPDFDLLVGVDNEGTNCATMLAYSLNKPVTSFWSTSYYNPDFIDALINSFPGMYGFVEVSSPIEKVSEGGTLDAIFNVLINELDVTVVGAQVILAKSDGYKRVEDKWGVPIRFLKKSMNNFVIP